MPVLCSCSLPSFPFFALTWHYLTNWKTKPPEIVYSSKPVKVFLFGEHWSFFYSTIFSMLHYQPVFSLDLSISPTHTHQHTHNTLSFSLERASSLSILRCSFNVFGFAQYSYGRWNWKKHFIQTKRMFYTLPYSQNRNEENEYSTDVHHVHMQSKWAEHTYTYRRSHSYSHNL